MAVPEFQSLMLPILESIGDGKTHTAAQVRESVIAALSLTKRDLAQQPPNGSKSVFMIRFTWAVTYLAEAGLLARPKRGRYRITPRGRETLAAGVSRITATYLYQCPEFKDFRNRWRKRP